MLAGYLVEKLPQMMKHSLLDEVKKEKMMNVL
jgi:hypothetical protein